MPYVMNILLLEYIIREAKSSFNPKILRNVSGDKIKYLLSVIYRFVNQKYNKTYEYW